jgi:hypothetical protein
MVFFIHIILQNITSFYGQLDLRIVSLIVAWIAMVGLPMTVLNNGMVRGKSVDTFTVIVSPGEGEAGTLLTTEYV